MGPPALVTGDSLSRHQPLAPQALCTDVVIRKEGVVKVSQLPLACTSTKSSWTHSIELAELVEQSDMLRIGGEDQGASLLRLSIGLGRVLGSDPGDIVIIYARLIPIFAMIAAGLLSIAFDLPSSAELAGSSFDSTPRHGLSLCGA